MNALRAAACAALFSWAAAAQADCKIQVMELPVHMEGSRAITTLSINGTQIPMMVDSGAFYSMLTRASADELGLPLESLPFGFRVEGFAGDMARPLKTTVKKVQLQKAEFTRPSASARDKSRRGPATSTAWRWAARRCCITVSA